jgi:hypothetical protein
MYDRSRFLRFAIPSQLSGRVDVILRLRMLKISSRVSEPHSLGSDPDSITSLSKYTLRSRLKFPSAGS